MFPETEQIDFTPIEIPQVRRGYWGHVKIGAALLAIVGATCAWQSGYRPPLFSQSTRVPLDFVEVDQGDVDIVVVEQGTLESAKNTPIRCLVEALIGTVGGAQGGTSGKASGTAGGGSGQGSGGAGGAQGGAGGSAGGGSGQGADASSKSKSKTKAKKTGSTTPTKSTSGSSGGSSSSSTSSSSSSSGSSTSSGTSSTSSGSGGTGAGGAGSSGTSTTSSKPVIRSFNYAVVAHVPLRPVTPQKTADSATQKKNQQGQGGGGFGGRGGRGGGRGRGGGGGGMMGGEDEKPGSTRILEIVPEGTRVKAGDIVAKLDGSAYEDEEQAQLIRYLQAKAYVEQANAILEVNQITLREYRDGIFPQDMQLVRQYIETCRLEKERLERNLAWSRDMLKKGFRTAYQVKGDELAYEQSKIALGEAEGMLDRLTKQTGPKILKALEANVRAIQSDKLTQDASFNLEDQRLKRIKKNIVNCIVRAPGDGIVVYANQTDRWGQVTAPIDEGVTLRQDQPIFNLPDPRNMRVKARINESKVSLIQSGQRVLIAVDAFPERPMRGTVAEVTQINTPLNGSDVRVYYANVDIEEGHDGLRPGLSAQVTFRIDSRRAVTRVPIESIRWVGEKAYVARYDRSRDDGEQSWRWRPIELGLSDSRHAEVLSGLQAGDRVVASPRALPGPTSDTIDPPATSVAGFSAQMRD
jgi:HlyD family secretion protein